MRTRGRASALYERENPIPPHVRIADTSRQDYRLGLDPSARLLRAVRIAWQRFDCATRPIRRSPYRRCSSISLARAFASLGFLMVIPGRKRPRRKVGVRKLVSGLENQLCSPFRTESARLWNVLGVAAASPPSVNLNFGPLKSWFSRPDANLSHCRRNQGSRARRCSHQRRADPSHHVLPNLHRFPALVLPDSDQARTRSEEVALPLSSRRASPRRDPSGCIDESRSSCSFKVDGSLSVGGKRLSVKVVSETVRSGGVLTPLC